MTEKGKISFYFKEGRDMASPPPRITITLAQSNADNGTTCITSHSKIILLPNTLTVLKTTAYDYIESVNADTDVNNGKGKEEGKGKGESISNVQLFLLPSPSSQAIIIDDIDVIRDNDSIYAVDGPVYPIMDVKEQKKDHVHHQVDAEVRKLRIPSGFAGVKEEDGTTSENRSDWVNLNVGGRIFSTTRSTLVHAPESMLARMFDSQMEWRSETDENGAFLFDRTPEYFVPILNFLRCGVITLDSGLSPEAVREEARFFNVTEMVSKLDRIVGHLIAPDTRSISRGELVTALLTSSSREQLRCQGLNMEGADLSKLDLRNINFRLTNFRKANLSGCALDDCDFTGANLEGADLEGATLRGCQLSGANMDDTNFKGCLFEDRGGSKATLDGATMRRACLEDCVMTGASMRVVVANGASFENASLRNANLAGADFQDCNLRGVNLQGTNLRGTNLQNANFDIRTVSQRAV